MLQEVELAECDYAVATSEFWGELYTPSVHSRDRDIEARSRSDIFSKFDEIHHIALRLVTPSQ